MAKITIDTIRSFKGLNSPFASVTAYDFTSASLIDQANIPLILVGDSAAMTVYGYDTTLPITMDEMIFIVSSVTRAATSALVVADMPFMSYQVSTEEAVSNAGRFIKESNAEAVKLEGGAKIGKSIQKIVDAGIPVMGHIGLTPQSFHQMSGYKVQGKTKNTAKKLIEDALAIQSSGAFSLVLEGIPSELAELITNSISIPTIGIGAGPCCDGQIQVFHDILGLYGSFVPKHTKQYIQLRKEIINTISEYQSEVMSKKFPQKQHSSHIDKKIINDIINS